MCCWIGEWVRAETFVWNYGLRFGGEGKIFHCRPDYNTDKVRSFAQGRITPFLKPHLSDQP